MLCNFERISNPARAVTAADRGAGRVSLCRENQSGNGRQTVAGGDFVRLELPGGGGFGDPAERDPEQVVADVADGLYTREAAERDYRVALTREGAVDRMRTAMLRQAQAAE